MTDSGENYDWGQAIYDLFDCESDDIADLVISAKLDPFNGDLADADFGGIDLSGFNLSKWDLRNANFSGSILTKTNLTDAILDPEALLTASDWQNAILSNADRKAVETAEFLTSPIYELDLSSRVYNILNSAKINNIKALISKSAADLLEINGFGRQSLKEVKNSLARYNLHLKSETALRRALRLNYYNQAIQTRFRFVGQSIKNSV